jgi:hypothetical protein
MKRTITPNALQKRTIHYFGADYNSPNYAPYTRYTVECGITVEVYAGRQAERITNIKARCNCRNCLRRMSK